MKKSKPAVRKPAKYRYMHLTLNPALVKLLKKAKELTGWSIGRILNHCIREYFKAIKEGIAIENLTPAQRRAAFLAIFPESTWAAKGKAKR